MKIFIFLIIGVALFSYYPSAYAYSSHSCFKPSKPTTPFRQDEYSINRYNDEVDTYNSNYNRYIDCINSYLSRAQSEIDDIQNEMRNAIRDAESSY